MADQIQTVTNGVQEQVSTYISSTLSTLDSWTGQAQKWAQDLLDKFIPPEQRAALLAKLQEFMLTNPKLSGFLAMNIALTGPALGLFTLFSLSVATFALIVGVLIGLGAAALFSLFCIGTALVLVFPVIFFTTMAACFLFLWGLGGYHLLKWLNGSKDGEEGEAKPLLSSGSIGDSLNSITGGRLTGFMESARTDKAKGDISGFSDEHTPPKPSSTGKTKVAPAQGSTVPTANTSKPQKATVHQQQQSVATPITASNSTAQAQKATKAAGVDSKVMTGTGAVGVVKGGVGGASGFA